MNIKRIYKKALEGSSQDYFLSLIKSYVGKNKQALTKITKSQWNGLLLFCMRKDNINDMITYIEEKMKKGESLWRETTTDVTAPGKEKIMAGEYIIKHLQKIKNNTLAEVVAKAGYKIEEAFGLSEDSLANILTDEEKEEIVLLQARLFIRTLVKNVLFT